MDDIERVIEDWKTILSGDPLDAPWDLIDETIELLKEKQQIVRCKDCKNRDECEIVDGCIADKDWFCADGERRQDDD